jgi:hypothetical protein
MICVNIDPNTDIALDIDISVDVDIDIYTESMYNLFINVTQKIIYTMNVHTFMLCICSIYTWNRFQ